MDLRDKITNALLKDLNAEYVRLEEDDGISGFVVSNKFKNLTTLDRQGLIDKVLNKGLSSEESRQVLLIAGFTRQEYETIGAPIRVHRIKPKPKGALEIVLHGVVADAEYVRGALQNEKGVKTTAPKSSPGAVGILMSFEATGTEANPLTKDRVLEILNKTRYIEVMPNA